MNKAIRNITIMVCVALPLYARIDRRTIEESFEHKSPQDVFSTIYETNYWLGTESRSGRGSHVVTTQTIREILPHLIEILNIKTILDAPCGDYNWMRHTSLALDLYVGVDIVPRLIKRNKETFSDTRHVFMCLDITKDPLPNADLIFCRDCLAHLSHSLGLSAIKNFKKTGSRYLMISTHPKTTQNVDIKTGHHYPVNMELAPFNFPKPLMLITETSAEPETRCQEKCLGIWKLEDIVVDKS